MLIERILIQKERGELRIERALFVFRRALIQKEHAPFELERRFFEFSVNMSLSRLTVKCKGYKYIASGLIKGEQGGNFYCPFCVCWRKRKFITQENTFYGKESEK